MQEATHNLLFMVVTFIYRLKALKAFVLKFTVIYDTNIK